MRQEIVDITEHLHLIHKKALRYSERAVCSPLKQRMRVRRKQHLKCAVSDIDK